MGVAATKITKRKSLLYWNPNEAFNLIIDDCYNWFSSIVLQFSEKHDCYGRFPKDPWCTSKCKSCAPKKRGAFPTVVWKSIKSKCVGSTVLEVMTDRSSGRTSPSFIAECDLLEVKWRKHWLSYVKAGSPPSESIPTAESYTMSLGHEASGGKEQGVSSPENAFCNTALLGLRALLWLRNQANCCSLLRMDRKGSLPRHCVLYCSMHMVYEHFHWRFDQIMEIFRTRTCLCSPSISCSA